MKNSEIVIFAYSVILTISAYFVTYKEPTSISELIGFLIGLFVFYLILLNIICWIITKIYPKSNNWSLSIWIIAIFGIFLIIIFMIISSAIFISSLADFDQNEIPITDITQSIETPFPTVTMQSIDTNPIPTPIISKNSEYMLDMHIFADNFIEIYNSQNLSGYYDLFIDEFKNTTPFDEFKLTHKIGENGVNLSGVVSIDVSIINKNSAMLQVDFSGTKKINIAETLPGLFHNQFKLINESGEWKIADFEHDEVMERSCLNCRTEKYTIVVSPEGGYIYNRY